MAYRFGLDESAQTGLRRIAREQAAKALKQLRNDRGDAVAIHECRKALKRLKALLKLVRGGLGKTTFKAEYRTVRDIGRSLSTVRDLEVMPNTLAYLVAVAASDPLVSDAEVPILSAIGRAESEVIEQADRRERLGDAITRLSEAGDRYKTLTLNKDRFEILAAGAASNLRQLHSDYEIATSGDDAEAYHEWRKSAQMHWRHLKLLAPVWPDALAARMRVVRALAQVLGLDHDLAILAAFVEKLPPSQLSQPRRQAVLQTAFTQQLELREEARSYGRLLIIEKPKRFTKRLVAYHSARCQIEALNDPLCDLDAPPL